MDGNTFLRVLIHEASGDLANTSSLERKWVEESGEIVEKRLDS